MRTTASNSIASPSCGVATTWTVRGVVPGDVVSVELKRKKERWYYKLKILTPAGKRAEVKIDAKTLDIFDRDEDDDD